MYLRIPRQVFVLLVKNHKVIYKMLSEMYSIANFIRFYKFSILLYLFRVLLLVYNDLVMCRTVFIFAPTKFGGVSIESNSFEKTH